MLVNIYYMERLVLPRFKEKTSGKHVSRIKKEKQINYGRILAGILGFCVGVAIFLYPFASAYVAQEKANAYVQTSVPDIYEAQAKKDEKKAEDEGYKYLKEYNQTIRDAEEVPLNDPFGIGSDTQALSRLGITDGVVGTLEIPSLHETVPLYMGAQRDKLMSGVCVIAGTCAPLGEQSSNVVIAGHRAAYSGLPMFRDIEDFAPGDTLTIRTPWDTMSYEYVDSYIVSPNDTSHLRIQPGQDIVTLFTCHPYGHNYQRILAEFKRVDADEVAEGQKTMALKNPISVALTPTTSPILKAERWLRVVGLVMMIGIPVYAIVSYIKEKE